MSNWQGEAANRGKILISPSGANSVHINFETRCPYRCIFCDVHRLSKRTPSSPIRHLLEELEAKQPVHPADSVTISCNEPFFDPDFFDLLDYLAARKVKRIEVVTTGIPLRERSVVERLATYPSLSVDLPIYGLTSRTHELVTGTKGGNMKLSTALGNLVDLKVPFTIHTVALKQNIKELDRLAESVVRTYDRMLYVRHLIPPSAEIALFRRLMPEYGTVRGLKSTAIIFLEFPPCALPHRQITPSTLSKDASFTRKARIAACERCADRKSCGGIYEMYLNAYGEP